MMPSATPPENAEKCPRRNHHQRVSRHPHHDGGNAVEHIGGKAHRVGQLGSAPELGQKDAAADADGNADQAAQGEQNRGAQDGVGHASANFPYGPWESW